MKNKTFRESIKRAAIGSYIGIKTEKNFACYAVIALVFFIANISLGSSFIEIAIFFAMTSAVFSAEFINTAIEHIANIVTPQYCEKIKVLKDVAAAGVLAMGVGFFITQGIILIPKVVQWI